MHLPGRVPWASITELDEVCSWIFQDENDIEKKTLAVHRVSYHTGCIFFDFFTPFHQVISLESDYHTSPRPRVNPGIINYHLTR